MEVAEAMGTLLMDFSKRRRRVGRNVGKWVLTLLMAGSGVLMIVPFLWMISASLKREAEVFMYPIRWIPEVFRFDNYKEVWTGSNPFGVFYLNSIKVAVLSVVGQVITSSMAAYAFARIPFRGRQAIFMLYLATMMIPQQVTLVPRFMLFDWLGMINTHKAVILPSIFLVFGVFMLRQFFLSIPFELSESATIDGAGEIRIWWQIIMPLAMPAISSLCILSFVWEWNEYLNPLIFLRDKSLFTIPLGLDYFMDEVGTQYSLMMAAAVSATLPLVLVYFAGQKFFIESVASSGVKG